MIYHIMHKDTPVADVYLSDDRKEISIKKLIMDGIKQPFRANVFNKRIFYEFLENRCYENCRANLSEILAAHGLKNNNPYEWVKISHGVTYEDFWWIKFDGEDISWEEVRIR